MYAELSKAGWGSDRKIPQPQLLDINGDGRSDLCGFDVDEGAFYCKLGIGYDPVLKAPRFGDWVKWGERFALKNLDTSAQRIPRRNTCWGTQVDLYAKQEGFSHFKIDIDIDGKAEYCGYYLSSSEFICFNKLPDNLDERTERFNRTFRFADINGDSLVDICYKERNSYVCRLNNGASFETPTAWLTFDSSAWPLSYRKSPRYQSLLLVDECSGEQLKVAKEEIDYDLKWVIESQEGSILLHDFDNDGLVDLGAVVADKFHIAYNRGDRFGSLRPIATLFPALKIASKKKRIYANRIKRWFGLSTEIETALTVSAYGPLKPISDTDGVSNSEIGFASAVGIGSIRIGNTPHALLKSVVDGFGNRVEISYAKIISDAIEDEYDPDLAKGYRAHYINRFVVKDVTSTDRSGMQNRIAYRYGKTVFDSDGRMLGFASISTFDEQQNRLDRMIFYREDGARNGSLKQKATYIDQKLVESETLVYEKVSADRPKMEVARLKERIYRRFDDDEEVISTVTERFESFNRYHLPQRSIKHTTDRLGTDHTVKTNTRYEHDTDRMLLNLPVRIVTNHE